ncbi:MAG: sugar transferase [Bacteroidetes bacterium]|nr:sugar transferase [Bacteroidota bacterium]
MRKHKLDELPQVWNVMKGDMSIIGPRPEMIEAYFYFLNSIPDYSKRKIIPQGITGWAQVNYNHTLTVEGNSRKLEFDIFYINNLSLKLDLIILIKTMKTVFTGNNSE